MLDIYGGEQGMNPPNDGISPTPNPTKLTVKREYTGMNSYHGVEQTTNQLYSFKTAHIFLQDRNKNKKKKRFPWCVESLVEGQKVPVLAKND